MISEVAGRSESRHDRWHSRLTARLAEISSAGVAVEESSADVNLQVAAVAGGANSRGRIRALVHPGHGVVVGAHSWHWGHESRREDNSSLRLGDMLDDGGSLSVVLSISIVMGYSLSTAGDHTEENNEQGEADEECNRVS